MRRIVVPTLLVAAVFLSVVSPASYGKVIYVDDDAPVGGDGASWATAYRFLQDALAVAQAGDAIRVARGLYRPDRSSSHPEGTGQREVSFEVPDGTFLQGGYAGLGAEDPNQRDAARYGCVLSGDLNGDDVPVSDPCDLMEAPSRLDNAYHVVRLLGGVLEGVEITGGYAHRYVSGIPYANWFTTDHGGGGIWGYGTARDCLIRDNYAEEVGGGVWCAGSWLKEERPVVSVQRCRFVGNATRNWGAGVHLMYCEADLQDCEFRENWAGSRGGGGDFGRSRTKAVDCRFTQNASDGSGGAFYSAGEGSEGDRSEFSVCTFAQNRAHYGGGGCSGSGVCQFNLCEVGQNDSRAGGALGANSSVLILKNTLVHGNHASDYGGAFCVRQHSSLQCLNCTVVANDAPEGSCVALGINSPSETQEAAVLSNCIIRNEGQELWNYDADVLIEHTNLVVRQDVWFDPSDRILLGVGNISTDPCFVDPGYWDSSGTPDDLSDDVWIEGDYHLKSQAGRWDEASGSWVRDDVTSPCIDAGDPNAPVGYEPLPDGDRINMGVYGGTLEASKSTVPEPVTSWSERYQALLDTLVGTSGSPYIVRSDGRYLYSFSTERDEYFAVAGVDVNDPNAVAMAFLDTWADLFMTPSGGLSMEISDTSIRETATFVNFCQKYGGLEVYCADIIVKVSPVGGVRYVVSDIMTDATVLDARPDTVRPSLDSLTAQRLVEVYMDEQSSHATYVALSAELMIYDPEVLHKEGAPHLVWCIVVKAVDSFHRYRVLADAHTGEVVYWVPLWRR